ncbi:MAG TPA: DUF742 domain-containing protein [Pseudonocardiaceae bacterium]
MTEGFTEPGRGECPAEFVTEYRGEPDTGYPVADTVNRDYSPDDGGKSVVDHSAERGFGWLGGPVGPAGLDDRPRPERRDLSPDLDDLADPAAMVRPYAWTRGRTRANHDLKLETLISTTDLGQDETRLLQLEHRSVSALCRYPLSVAEVAAKLSVPLGVARVVLSDMAEQGLISIHRTFADDDIAAHLVLMERVLSGLRRL